MGKRKSGSVAAPKEEPERSVGKVAEVAAEATATAEEGWRKRAGLVVSEQIPVGAMWLPSWDVGIMAESYITSLYSDVWDGDIWGLRSPPPSTTSTPPTKATFDHPPILYP